MGLYKKKYKLTHPQGILLLILLLMLNGCSATKFIPPNAYLLDKVKVSVDNKNVSKGELKSCVRQRENSRWFSLIKVPMSPYALSGQDSTKRINRFLQRIGQAPVVYDSLLADRSATRITSVVANAGYLDAKTTINSQIRGRKIRVEYSVETGNPYIISSIEYHIDDPKLRTLLADSTLSLLKRGERLNINKLDGERGRINTLLHNEGYYKFHKENITFNVDTCSVTRDVALQCTISETTQNRSDSLPGFTPYYIRKVYILSDIVTTSPQESKLDTTSYENFELIYQKKPRFRAKLFSQNTLIEPSSLYRERNIQGTYNNYGGLQGVKYSTIRMVEVEEGKDSLDCFIQVTSNKANSVGFEVEGTNTVGDLGAAAALTLQNRNIFRGSEVLSLKVRGAFEAITGLEGYFDQNYFEVTTEAGITLPTIDLPFMRKSTQKTLKSSTEISFLYNSQNRPEFHRRVVTGVWRYRWNQFGSKSQHRLDLLDLNYVFMPWISDTFREDYLENENTQNSILRYNYENLFIMKLGYSYAYNSLGGVNTSTYGRNAFALRFNIESSGNLLYGISNLLNAQQNSEGRYTLFNIAYAEYVKGDFDFSKSFSIDPNNSVAFHIGLGVAYPYGNSQILPYEKRYFSGGANSVRGWSVRELGPGSYSGGNGRIDFINQTGDIKLDINLEYRTVLFWKLNGAVFIDAGNIWTIRNYEDQPGGQFKLDTFWKQIAVAYGAGVRLNFDYFIIRLDAGMRAIDPVHTTRKEQFPIINPKLSRDFAFHFAVGLPF